MPFNKNLTKIKYKKKKNSFVLSFYKKKKPKQLLLRCYTISRIPIQHIAPVRCRPITLAIIQIKMQTTRTTKVMLNNHTIGRSLLRQHLAIIKLRAVTWVSMNTLFFVQTTKRRIPCGRWRLIRWLDMDRS